LIFIQGENILLVGGQTPAPQVGKAAAAVLSMPDLRKVGCCIHIFTMPFTRQCLWLATRWVIVFDRRNKIL